MDTRVVAAAFAIMGFLGSGHAAPPADGLQPQVLSALPLGSIQPSGWIRNELATQANGLSGHLDEFWPDIKDSGWIGGQAEGWERAPYWLDGLVPLAYLLDDEVLKGKVRRFMDYALEHQAEDGWLGPERSATGKYKKRDPWPVFVMMKAMTQYHEAASDPRVIPAIRKFLTCLDRQLATRPLFDWNRMRWQDGALSVYWLYEKTGESWLLDLARRLKQQGYDWPGHFRDLPHKQKAPKWEHESHVVSNAMGIKSAAVCFRLSGDAADAAVGRLALDTLDKHHGQATGLFSGDECLAGRMPSQGTETCAVVEYLYSLEVLLQGLGDPAFGDRLETIAYNSLPAPFKPDMWARQYVQQANQPVAKTSPQRIYTTNGEKANLYGLETNYGCCTANMHQGWPKFVSHLWMKTGDEGMAAVAYAPSKVSVTLKQVGVSIETVTEYPFAGDIKIIVTPEKPLRFSLWLRIPAWSDEISLLVQDRGKTEQERLGRESAGRFKIIDREWKTRTEVVLGMAMPVRVERRYRDAITLKRGPLVFSLKIGEEWKQVGGEAPHADWEVRPTTPWNYALQVDADEPTRSVSVHRKPILAAPFSAEGAPVELRVQGRRLPHWTLEKNAAAAPPPSPVDSSEPLQSLVLIPYGSAKLRVTEFPQLR